MTFVLLVYADFLLATNAIYLELNREVPVHEVYDVLVQEMLVDDHDVLQLDGILLN